jgi:hypothetical protein
MNDQFVVLNIHNLSSSSQNVELSDCGSNAATLPEQVSISIHSLLEEIFVEPTEYF